MKLIIAGGRDYTRRRADALLIKSLWKAGLVDEIVSGCAAGADAYGEIAALMLGVPMQKFPADWDTHGKAAGPIRNREMAEYADAVVLLPGGRGTESMYQEAKRAGLIIFDLRAEWPST